MIEQINANTYEIHFQEKAQHTCMLVHCLLKRAINITQSQDTHIVKRDFQISLVM